MAIQREIVTLVQAALDPVTQKEGIEEKLKAVEEWNNMLLERAERMDSYFYIKSNPQSLPQRMPNSGAQLCLVFTDKCL